MRQADSAGMQAIHLQSHSRFQSFIGFLRK